jgi:hypothetical protein
MSGLALAVFLVAQAAPAAAPGTELRALTVSVVDEKTGDAVDLAASDVALTENGIARDIASFKPDARPLSVAVLVDSSAAAGSDFRLSLVDAVVGLIARLPPGTRYSLWTTGDRPTKCVDFTDAKEAALRALQRVPPQGGNTMLDALAEASADLRKLTREGDRTAVVALTLSGPELSSRDRFRSAEEAEKNAELFLMLQVETGESDFEMRSSLSYVLDRLAVASGGRHDVVLSSMSADAALRRLSKLLLAGYRLSYATVPDLKKRKLELSVARPGTTVLLPSGPRS